MNVAFINPFVAATRNVFSTMLGCEVTRGELATTQNAHPPHDVSGIIGLSGDAASGTVILSLDRQVAVEATAAMLGETPDDLSQDVVDAVGEVTNMIAGGAKAQLEALAMSLSLPTVVVGQAHLTELESQAQRICIPFSCEWGQLTVQVGLVSAESSSPQVAAC